jgi:hypothetical protein
MGYRANQLGTILASCKPDHIAVRTSLYADDAGLFLKPTIPDVRNVQQILIHFGKASGLNMNMAKSTLFSIQTDPQVLHSVAQQFQGSVGSFPATYIGMPLHFGRVTRAAEQLVVDKIAHRLAGWKGRLLNSAGKLFLVNSVLSAIPVYWMTSVNLSNWAIKKIDRLRRNFLFKSNDDHMRGHYPVNWNTVCRPKKLGGLGVKHLSRFNRALRLRWLWYKWADTCKPWATLPHATTEAELVLFRSYTVLPLGNGERINF